MIRPWLSVCFCLTCAPALLQAAAIDVTSQKSGSWTAPATWALASGYPDNALDPATTYNVTLANVVSLTLPSIAPTVTDFTMTSGFITGNGTAASSISVADHFSLQGGVLISLTLHLLSTATADITQNIVWAPNSVAIVNDGVFNAGNANLSNITFTNNGTLTLNATVGSTRPYGSVLSNNGTSGFTNQGLVQVQGGTLTLNMAAPSNGAGSYSVAGGATLDFSEDSDLPAGAAVTGAGNVTFAPDQGAFTYTVEGQLQITGALTISQGNVTLSSAASAAQLVLAAAVTGSGSLTVSGQTSWYAGGSDLTGGLSANGGITFANQAAGLYSLGHSVIADGVSVLGHPNYDPQSTVKLKPGATFTNKGSMTLYASTILPSDSNTGPSPTLINTGTLTIDSGSTASGGSATLGSYSPGDAAPLIFQNSGLVHIKTGTLELKTIDSGGIGGQFQIDAGTSLLLGGSVAFSASSSISGAGNVTIAAPTTFNGQYNVIGATLATAAATFNADASFQSLESSYADLSGTGHLTVAGTFTWTHSNLKVASLTANGGIVFDQPNELMGTLVNGPAATSTLTGLWFEVAGGGALINDGTLNLKTEVIHDYLLPTPAPRLINHGTLNVSISTASGITDSSVAFINTGLVNIATGKITLAFQDPATTGEFHVASVATLAFLHNYDFSSLTGPTLTGDGMVIIDAGATLTLPIDTAFAGTIEVDGTLLLAPARNPLDINASPAFTVLSAPVPEPASLALCAAALPLLLNRRRHR